MHADDRLLTVAEVALLLRCSTRHVNHLRVRGELGAVRTGHRSIRYRLSDVGEFIDARVEPASERVRA